MRVKANYRDSGVPSSVLHAYASVSRSEASKAHTARKSVKVCERQVLGIRMLERLVVKSAQGLRTLLFHASKTYVIISEGYFGGARRNRTDDLFNAIEALSQLSYGPTIGSCKQDPVARSLWGRPARR